MVDADRPNGFLTPRQRAFLRGEESVTPGHERVLRHRIRKRVRNAMLDFGLVFEHLSARDRRQILDRDLERTDKHVQALKTGRSHPYEAPVESPYDAPPELTWDGIYSMSLGRSIFTGGMRAMQAFSVCLLRQFLVEEYGVDEISVQAEIYAELTRQAILDGLAKSNTFVDIDVDINLRRTDVDLERLRETLATDPDQLTATDLERLVAARVEGIPPNTGTARYEE